METNPHKLKQKKKSKNKTVKNRKYRVNSHEIVVKCQEGWKNPGRRALTRPPLEGCRKY